MPKARNARAASMTPGQQSNVTGVEKGYRYRPIAVLVLLVILGAGGIALFRSGWVPSLILFSAGYALVATITYHGLEKERREYNSAGGIGAVNRRRLLLGIALTEIGFGMLIGGYLRVFGSNTGDNGLIATTVIFFGMGGYHFIVTSLGDWPPPKSVKGDD